MSEPTPLLTPLRPPSTEPRLWKDGRFVADAWRNVGDGTDIPIEGRAILSLARWRAQQHALAALGTRFGVKVQSGEALDPATDDLHRLQVIALVFPIFTDGRAYSTARRLRESQGFKGEIRATGDVLLDQLPLMLRCGFDAFEIVHVPTIAALELAPIPAISRVYQSVPERGGQCWNSRRAAAE